MGGDEVDNGVTIDLSFLLSFIKMPCNGSNGSKYVQLL